MQAQDLIQNAHQYGFLGPIVGIAGLMIAASTAILFGWTRTLDAWKPPPSVLPDPLSKIITMLCSVAICLAFILAEPAHRISYIKWTLWLAGACVIGFLCYVALKATCGRFRRPLVDSDNKPAGEETIWGGVWLVPRARKAILEGSTVEEFLAGNQYDKSKVWPASSLLAAAVLTALVLLIALVCGTAAITTAAATAQVELTGKPARQIFDAKDVPGLPAPKSQEVKRPAPK